MEQRNSAHNLQEQWVRAVERAIEDIAYRDELAQTDLNTLAGLSIKAGVRAGAWASTDVTHCCDTAKHSGC